MSYQWKDTDTDEVLSTSYSVSGLSAGNYEVSVSDGSGCSDVAPITFSLAAPEALDIPIIEDIQTSCDATAGSGEEGGTALGYSSGVAPYIFSWYMVKDYETTASTTVTKEILVFEESVALGEISTYEGITPGDYKVIITDANGCKVESSITAVTEPPVERNYNLCLSWRSTPERESEAPSPISQKQIPAIGPSSFRQALSAKVERCISNSQAQIENNVDALLDDPDYLKDELVINYDQGKEPTYQFTLYYYDRMGNLSRTVPPEGVRTVSSRVPTSHKYITGYSYNSIAQLIGQETPDGGKTAFIYDNIGRLWYSQNERQLAEQKFSYMIYDELGRVIEGGEANLSGKSFPTDFIANGDDADITVASAIAEVDKTEFVKSVYNDKVDGITYQDESQRFLRNRISHVYNKDKNGTTINTYYSYDPHGNVAWCVQELPDIGKTTVAYDYDLVSGNVNEAIFNEGQIAEYHHKYTYDEDNRIVSVQTSKDGYYWDEDARYDYYLHGPLMRAELGEDKIQGCDYTYTIHGWLKGINTPDLTASAYNPDGNHTRADDATKHAKDEFGMALGYYAGDFTRDGVFNSNLTAGNPFNVTSNLYNGNIGSWTSQIAEEAKTNNTDSYLTASTYEYDELNRIKSSSVSLYNASSETYGNINGSTSAYSTNYSYDKNGNLLTLQRYKDDGALMDDLTYHYDLTAENYSNKLTHVTDAVGQVSAEINDLPNQSANNYEYDATGRLIRDNSEGLTYIWNSSNKISEIVPDNTGDEDTQKVHMSFTYDANGMRVVKTVNRLPYNIAGEGPAVHEPAAVETTYYAYDPSGNTMGVYKRKDTKVNPDNANDNLYTATFSISERPIYGSDRLGQDVYEEIIDMRTYLFNDEINYNEIEVSNTALVTSGLQNVLLVQNNDQELTDVSGGTVTVTATNLSHAIVDTSFDELAYAAKVTENDAVLPIQTDNNVIVIEDKEGTLLSYGIVAENYYNVGTVVDSATTATDTTGTDTVTDTSTETITNRPVLLLYTNEGDLVEGLELLNSDDTDPVDPKAKTVVVRHPSDASTYYLFYRDQASGLHSATLEYSEGVLSVTKNEDFSYTDYGRHMAVIQDDQNKVAYVYATMHSDAILADDGTISTPAGSTIVRFTIDEAGTINFDGTMLPEYFESYDTDGSGELQISSDGTQLSIYHNTSLPTAWTGNTDAAIKTWDIDEETRLLDATSETNIEITNGNIGKGSLINTGSDIYYTQYTQEVTTNVDNKVVKRASDDSVISTSGIGDLRLNIDDKLYQYTAGTNTGEEWNTETEVVSNLTNLPSTTAGNTGYQAYQPYSILEEAEEQTDGIVYRTVGNKFYELKDHLGNVRVVVSDRKNLDPATEELTANVESYNNYYAFGMLQPNRNKDSKDYRYGFNGKEKDDEIKGEGNSIDFGARMYDSRLGRFFTTDPFRISLPAHSPYNYALNSTILLKDSDGEFPVLPDGTPIFFDDNPNMEWIYENNLAPENVKYKLYPGKDHRIYFTNTGIPFKAHIKSQKVVLGSKEKELRNKMLEENIEFLYDCAGSVFMNKTNNKTGPIWIYYNDVTDVWTDENSGEFEQILNERKLKSGDVLMTTPEYYHFMFLDGKDEKGNLIVYSKNELAKEQHYTLESTTRAYPGTKFYRHKGNFDISKLKSIVIGEETITGKQFIEKYVGKDGRISDKVAAEALKVSLREENGKEKK